MSDGPKERRLDVDEARARAAKACGVDVSDVGDPTAYAWGWSFPLATGGGRVFVDGRTGLAATSDPDDDRERVAALRERGPLGVPPWSPPPKRSWWSSLVRALRGRSTRG